MAWLGEIATTSLESWLRFWAARIGEGWLRRDLYRLEGYSLDCLTPARLQNLTAHVVNTIVCLNLDASAMLLCHLHWPEKSRAREEVITVTTNCRGGCVA